MLASASGPNTLAATPGRSGTPISVTLSNTGAPPISDPGFHPDDASDHVGFDVYRLSVSVEGDGWSARLLNALAAVEVGGSQPITVYVSREEEGSGEATLTLRATSESDPTKAAVTTVSLVG